MPPTEHDPTVTAAVAAVVSVLRRTGFPDALPWNYTDSRPTDNPHFAPDITCDRHAVSACDEFRWQAGVGRAMLYARIGFGGSRSVVLVVRRDGSCLPLVRAAVAENVPPLAVWVYDPQTRTLDTGGHVIAAE